MFLDGLFKFSRQLHAIRESAQFPRLNQEKMNDRETYFVWIDRAEPMTIGAERPDILNVDLQIYDEPGRGSLTIEALDEAALL